MVVLRGHGFSRCQGCFNSVDSEYTNTRIRKTPRRGRENRRVVKIEVLDARHLLFQGLVKRCGLDAAQRRNPSELQFSRDAIPQQRRGLKIGRACECYRRDALSPHNVASYRRTTYLSLDEGVITWSTGAGYRRWLPLAARDGRICDCAGSMNLRQVNCTAYGQQISGRNPDRILLRKIG